jgi:hypothetical protein
MSRRRAIVKIRRRQITMLCKEEEGDEDDYNMEV